MTVTGENIKKKLFIKLYPESDARRMIPGSEKAVSIIQNLRRDDVRKIYIIASNQSVSRPYISLFRKEIPGIMIRDMAMEKIGRQDIYSIKSIIDDINAFIRTGQSCEIILFNESLAGVILACFYVNTGKNTELSIEQVRKIIPGVALSGSDLSFIREFNNLIRETCDVPPEPGTATREAPAEPAAEPMTVTGTVQKRERTDAKDSDAMRSYIERAEPAGVLTRFRIATKLIALVSLVLVFSLSLMIFLGTAFFKRNSLSVINTGNATAARLIGERMQGEINSSLEKARVAAEVSSMGRSTEELASRVKEMLFRNKGDFIFMGIAVKDGDGLKLKKSLYNDDYINGGPVSRDMLQGSIRKNAEYFAQSFGGRILVRNVSPEAGAPVLGVSFPYRRKGGSVRSVIICYLSLKRLMDASRLAGPVRTYMVGDRGECVVNAERNLVLSRVSMAEVPVVKKMLLSTAGAGDLRYRDGGGLYHLASYRKLDAYGLGVIVTAPEDSLLRGVYDARRRNFIIMAIILVAAVLGAFIFSKTISGPIEELRQVAASAPPEVLKLSSSGAGDEVFYLAQSFKEVLRSYLDSQEKLDDYRRAEPRAAEGVTGGAGGPAAEPSREGMTQQFRTEGLKIQVTYDGPAVFMVWMGRGSLVNPGELLNPYLEGIVNSMRGRELACDFSSLESMNAAIVQSIIRFAHVLYENRIQAKFIYNRSIDWQDASFEALSAVVQEMDTISLDGRILGKNMFIL